MSLTLTELKQGIKYSDKDSLRDAIDTHGEEVVKAALMLDITADNIDEAYQGTYTNDEDFAQNMAEQTGAINKEMNWPYTCIDWTFAAKELMYDYCEDNGHYFRNL